MAEKKTDTPPESYGLLDGTRRDFLKKSSFLTAIALTPTSLVKAAESGLDEKIAAVFEKIPINITVNGV